MSQVDRSGRVFGSSNVALNGTTHATLVAAPPEGVAYRIFRVMGTNTSGGARVLVLHLNEATVVSLLYFGVAVATTEPFITGAGAQPNEFAIHLTDTDQSLEIDVLAGACTDVVYAFYEILES